MIQQKKRKGRVIAITGIGIFLVLLIMVILFVNQRQKLSLKNKIEIKQNQDATTQILYKAEKGEGTYTVYQLPMTDEAGGCCYAITLPSGKLIMIDSGYQSDAQYIQDFIMEHGGKVDSWFITHPHFDHVGGLLPIVQNAANSGMVIEKIYYAPFTEEFFTKEEEGKNLEVLNKASLFTEFETLKEQAEAIKFIPLINADEVIIEEIKITCMSGFDAARFDVNANSLVLHFDIKGATLLITGDITDQSVLDMCAYWGEENPLWKVDFMQIPHHGYMAGISNDKLYRLTEPSVAFLDCSTKEYEENAVNIQEHLLWLENLQIPIVRRYQGINEIIIE